MENYKTQLIDALEKHIHFLQEKILVILEETKVYADKSIVQIGKMRSEDQPVAMQLKFIATQRIEELNHLKQSPYFVKCEIIENETGQKKTYYFGKYQLAEESIYSWIAPIAAIRFEDLGKVSYRLPGGEQKELTIISRDQYMIVNGEVIFFAREDTGKPRDLIYQKHFTVQKTEFILPEIVAQMEKAQDQVIRAHHYGPLVISGPAGSGKTTLALHRVAYLTQAPDTAGLYPTDKVVVFVQDNGTKEYFSHLLPGLGIHNVLITTFSEWAMKILDIRDYEYISRYGGSDEEKDLHEYKKIQRLREETILPEYNKNPTILLSKYYRGIDFYEKQKKEKKVDRFDLTLLLMSYFKKYGKIESKRTYESVTDGILKKRTQKIVTEYSLVIVDEFQNYLPEQLAIFKACLSKDTKATIYVGDLAQQVYLGTIKNWEDIGETISPERKIRLDKVYRNTKSILSFIQSLGYQISVPEGIKDGPAVTEKILTTIEEEISYIKAIAEKYKEGSVGILAKNQKYLQKFKEAFKCEKYAHVLTMSESQGVEFDLVCIVGIALDTFEVTEHEGVLSKHLEERKSIQKDLLYVALTRAITEMHIIGRLKLQEVIKI